MVNPKKYDYSRAPEILAAFDANSRVMALAKQFELPYRVVYKIVVSNGRVIPRNTVGSTNDLPEKLPPIPAHLLAPYVPRTVPDGQVSASMKSAADARREAGQEPLAPFHPISRAALPRLMSLER